MTHQINLIALALVPAVLWLAWQVCDHYWPRLKRPQKTWGAVDYLIAGVFVHFAITAIGNTAFWALHFGGEAFQNRELIQWTYEHGQLANIFTRMSPYIAAALLHLAAASMQGVPGVRPVRWYLVISALMTVATYLLLRILI